MTRNLKAMMLAALALASFAAISTSASASTEFHCSASPCKVTAKPDGTGKTAHHVIAVWNKSHTESMSTTCETISGEASMLSSTEIEIGNIQGQNCTLNGSAAQLVSNGCGYVLHAGGTLDIKCPAGKEFENHGFGNECSYNFPEQKGRSGVKFHNVGSTELTVELSVSNIEVKLVGKCAIKEGYEAEFQTGNFLITGETIGGVMANLWWE